MTGYPAHWTKARKAWHSGATCTCNRPGFDPCRLCILLTPDEVSAWYDGGANSGAAASVSAGMAALFALWDRQDAAAGRLRAVSPQEGDVCPHCRQGDMGYRPVEGCSCHINPPCSRCVDNPLVCLSCGWNEDDGLEIESCPDCNRGEFRGQPCPKCQDEIDAGDALERKIAAKRKEIEPHIPAAWTPRGLVFERPSGYALEELADIEAERTWITGGMRGGLFHPERAPSPRRPPVRHDAPEIIQAMAAMASSGGHMLGTARAMKE
jgi:hypothetical protein